MGKKRFPIIGRAASGTSTLLIFIEGYISLGYSREFTCIHELNMHEHGRRYKMMGKRSSSG
jgi:hypothetical protein